ncbi:MAG: hypothetical protein ABIO63_03130 [Casimicrobiaceae bacterium]
MSTFTQVELFTNPDQRAQFRETAIPLSEGSELARLSAVAPATGLQFRHSPIGFASPFHCSPLPQWLIILSGIMEIGLQDGSARRFGPGECFLAADTLPAGATFDAKLHGHRSAQVGPDPLVTLFVKV